MDSKSSLSDTKMSGKRWLLPGGQVSGVTSPGRPVGNDGGVRKKPNLVLVAPTAALPCQLMQPGGVRLSQRRCVSRTGHCWRSETPSPWLGWCLEVSDHLASGAVEGAMPSLVGTPSPGLLLLVGKATGAWPAGSRRGA